MFPTLAAILDNPSINYKGVAILFLIGNFTLNAYLNYREYKFHDKKEKTPGVLKNVIDAETFEKSKGYTRDNLKMDMFRQAVSLIRDVARLKCDYYPHFWNVAHAAVRKLSSLPFVGKFLVVNTILQSVMFFALNFTVSTIISWVTFYIHTFHLEERWGFNKYTHAKFAKDKLKEFLVLQVVLAPLVYLFVRILTVFGDSFIFYAMTFALVAELFVQTIIPNFILPFLYKLYPLEEGPLRKEIEALAKKNGFPVSQLLVMEGSVITSHSNAFMVGLPWCKRIVLFDTLIEQSSIPEIVAILGHEIGHWKLNHIPQMIFRDQISHALTFITFSVFAHNESLFRSFGFSQGISPLIALILVSYLTWPIDIVNKLQNNLLIRRNEYQADKFASDLGYTNEIASGLIRLDKKNLTNTTNDWLYALYNVTHPNLVERLTAVGYDPSKAETEEKNFEGSEKIIESVAG